MALPLLCGLKDPAAVTWPGHRFFGCAGPASGVSAPASRGSAPASRGSAQAPAEGGAFRLLLPDSGFPRRGGWRGAGSRHRGGSAVLKLPALLPAIPASCGPLTSSCIPALALALPRWASCGSLPNGSVHLELGPGVSKLRPVTTFSPGPTFMALELRVCLDF